ncbi:MAG: hypothetical protein ACOCUV_03445 [bacterium]
MLFLIRKKINPIVLLGLIVFVVSFSDGNASINPKSFEKKLSGEIFYKFPDVIGSMFLYEEWITGDVILECGAKVCNQKLKYSGYLNELFWLREKDNLTVKLDKGMIECFILKISDQSTRSFRKFHSLESGSGEDVFIEELYSGTGFSLFAKRDIVERGTQTEHVNQRVYQRTKVEPKTIYIIINQKSGKSCEFYRITRRNIYRALGYEKTIIREIIRRHNISLAFGEDELKRLIELMDSSMLNGQ